MKRPDFFIVGAPKCGTRSLHEYLKQHPDIFMGRRERHYFGKDLDFVARRHRMDETEYLAMFADAGAATHLGEKSVYYLYSESAPYEMKAFHPDAKAVIMLRNPVDQMYSLYYQTRFTVNEDAPSFEEALALEAQRRAGQCLPPLCTLPRKTFYRANARYTEYVRHYFDVLGPDHVHVIILDDLMADAAGVMRRLMTFLGADPDFAFDLRVHNASKVRRSYLVRALQGRSYRMIPRSLRSYVPQALINGIKNSLLPAVDRWNTKQQKRPPLDPQLERELREEFAPEVAALGALLGRDLSHWSQPR